MIGVAADGQTRISKKSLLAPSPAIMVNLVNRGTSDDDKAETASAVDV
jgi:hypothetical protein